MHHQPVEREILEREVMEAGELGPRQRLVLGGVGEIVGGLRVVQPQRLLRRSQLLAVDEPLDDREASLANLVELLVGHLHPVMVACAPRSV